MYNLSERFQTTRSQTGRLLGPNYYTLNEPPDIKPCYVPFYSKTGRKIICNKIYTDAIYNVDDRPRIIGGSSLNNRAARVTFGTAPDQESQFADDIEDDPLSAKRKRETGTPGPAYYDPTHIRKPIKATRRTRKLYVCKVPFFYGAKGPSVPSRIDENGYTVDNEDTLIKLPPDVVDTSLGPAYYCIKECPNMAKRLYGGCKWSSRTAPRRTITALNDYPGPGAYDVNVVREDPCAEIVAHAREMAIATANMPRTLEAIQQKSCKENLPGPCAYNVSKPLVPRSANEYSAFNVSAARFRTKIDELPGPGDYEVTSSLIRKKVSHLEAGFGSKKESSMWRKNEKAGLHKSELSGSSEGPKYLRFSAMPFDTSAPRMKDRMEDLPGPADYVHEADAEDVVRRPTSMFKSCSRRFPTIRRKDDTPNCATFNLSAAFNRMKDRKSFAKKEVSFSSTAERVTVEITDNPGPCDAAPEKASTKGFYFPMKRRFDDYDNGVPGPGTYLLQAAAASALYKTKATYNIRLRENVVGAKLRLPPKVTRDDWMQEKCKRKILKVFQRPEVQQFLETWVDIM